MVGDINFWENDKKLGVIGTKMTKIKGNIGIFWCVMINKESNVATKRRHPFMQNLASKKKTEGVSKNFSMNSR